MARPLLTLALLLAACGDDDSTCPPGSVPSEGRCITMDADARDCHGKEARA